VKLEQAESHRIAVSLSRRNLLTLLHKLHTPGSARTLTIQSEHPRTRKDAPLMPLLLVVHGETNEQHYDGRPEPRGPMLMDASAATQVAIDLLQQVEDSVEMEEFDASTLRKTISHAEYLRDRFDRTARTAVIH
jgi:hypothetical protein